MAGRSQPFAYNAGERCLVSVEDQIMSNSFGSEGTLNVGEKTYLIHRLSAVEKAIPSAGRLPFSLKILLENLLRTENGQTVRAGDIEALARWDAKAEPSREIAFTPSRVLMQ